MRLSRTSLRTNALLLCGLLAAPLAWTAQLVVGYGLAEAECSEAGMRWQLHADAWEVALSASAAGVGLAGLVLAARLARVLGRQPDADEHGRMQFMARGGVLVSCVFLALIVLGAIGAVSVGVCTQA